MKMRLLMIPGLLALLSCTGRHTEPADTAAAAGERAVGTVRVVGSLPLNVQVVLQPEDGRSIELVGPLRDELRNLSGAVVAVSGPVERSPNPMTAGQLQASGYEILSVDGEPVITGTVEGRTSGWTLLRTPGGELVYLASAPDEFRPGQKVWVQGPRSVVVQSYGVIRP